MNQLLLRLKIFAYGYAKYFLGLEIARSSDGTYINQHIYALDILKDASLLEAKPTLIPMPRGIKFSANQSALLSDPNIYT